MITVIDISQFQPCAAIDYDKLAGAVDGVILRCAYGTRKDTAFEQHYAEFKRRGIPMGVYLFLVGYKTSAEQVIVMRNAIAGKEFKLGLWNDSELEKGATPLTAKHVIDFMNLAEAEFGELGIYTGHWCWQTIMGNEYARYSTRKLWASGSVSYESFLKYYYPHGWDVNDWVLWQYTSHGRLPGYNSDLDINKFNGDEAAWKAWTGATIIPKPPVDKTKVISVATVQIPVLRMRAGAGTGYPIVGSLSYGQVVEILEVKNVGADTWARVGQGQWSAMKYNGLVYIE